MIAQTDPKHDFSNAKDVALKGIDDPDMGDLDVVELNKPPYIDIQNLLLEIVSVEARYNYKDAKETALMIEDPYQRVIALAIVAKAAQSHFNSLAP